ncbi:hypothetical protein [Ascidiimonas sp. W6]|uniref:hypothetical protein n=1 Tax=Ascidiimonas meishanensis TaxID=3128903 RepID=UPI0030ED8C55
MKKKNFNTLKLNKSKIANLKTSNSIIGASGTCNAESNIICPVGDSDGCTGGGGGGGALTITCNWMCNPTQDVCGITQVTCACG